MSEDKKVRINIKCIRCGKTYSMIVNKLDLDRWNNGELAQRCFTYLTPDQRELLISQVCGSCFDKIFERP